MASRVNTKFVAMLAGVLLLAFGAVAGSAYFFLYNTGADLTRMGDKKMALGQYKEASDLYSKAVNKEKTNVAFLEKWVESIRKQTPDTQQKYRDAYMNLNGAMRQLAIVGRDVGPQREFLEMIKTELDPIAFKRDNYDSFLNDIET